MKQHHLIPEIPEDIRSEAQLPIPDHQYVHIDIKADGMVVLHQELCPACWMGIPPSKVEYEISLFAN